MGSEMPGPVATRLAQKPSRMTACKLNVLFVCSFASGPAQKEMFVGKRDTPQNQESKPAFEGEVVVEEVRRK